MRWPGGACGLYSVVERDDYALVLPREGEGFWLVEQYRYTATPSAVAHGSSRPAAGRTTQSAAARRPWRAPSCARRQDCVPGASCIWAG